MITTENITVSLNGIKLDDMPLSVFLPEKEQDEKYPTKRIGYEIVFNHDANKKY